MSFLVILIGVWWNMELDGLAGLIQWCIIMGRRWRIQTKLSENYYEHTVEWQKDARLQKFKPLTTSHSAHTQTNTTPTPSRFYIAFVYLLEHTKSWTHKYHLAYALFKGSCLLGHARGIVHIEAKTITFVRETLHSNQKP